MSVDVTLDQRDGEDYVQIVRDVVLSDGSIGSSGLLLSIEEAEQLVTGLGEALAKSWAKQA